MGRPNNNLKPQRIDEHHGVIPEGDVLVEAAVDTDGVFGEPAAGDGVVPAGAEVVEAGGPGVFAALEEEAIAEGGRP